MSYVRPGASAPERPRPVPDLRGIDRQRRAAQHGRPRAPRRRARLPPLLGRRAPRRRDARRAQPRGPDRADRGGHAQPARRQRRRDAARTTARSRSPRRFSRAQRPVPRADRPRPRPGVGHRSAHDARAAARPPPARRPTTSPSQLAELLGLPRGRPARRASVRAARGAARAARGARSRGCWARRRRARSGPRQLGLPYAFADFINPGGAELAEIYRQRFDDAPRLDAPRQMVAVWALAADDRRGGRAPGVEQPHGDVAAAPRPADRGPAGRRRRCATSPSTARPDRHGGRARDPGLGRGGARRPRAGRRRLRRRGGHRRDDHPRPRRRGGAPTSSSPRPSPVSAAGRRGPRVPPR